MCETSHSVAGRYAGLVGPLSLAMWLAAAPAAAAGAPAAASAAAEPVEAIPSPQVAEVSPPAPTPEPEYHPLALQEPEPLLAEPTPAQPAPGAAQPAAAKPSQPARAEREPIDLLAISGAKGMVRRAAPVLIVVALVVVALVVWLIVR